MRVLCFHNIVPHPLDPFDRRIYRTFQDAFARALARLRQRYEILSLPEMLECLHRGSLLPNAITITFDDAFAGVFDCARPILQDLNATATVFLPTSFYAGPEPGAERFALLHFEELEIAFRLTPLQTLALPELGLSPLSLINPMQRAAELVRLKAALKKLAQPTFLEAQALALDRLQVGSDEISSYARANSRFHKLSREQIRTLLAEGWTMGGHTRRHYPLSTLDPAALEVEIAGNAADLVQYFGLRDVPFAYPYGAVGNPQQAIPDAVRRAGFSCAFTTERRVLAPEDDRFQLGRFGERDVLYDLLESTSEAPASRAAQPG